ncbi:MAG: DNA-binding response regulator [Acidimicrobiales bacterium]|jgi:DNA-binding NarL/FixJ family response regulator|nr:DNA-binding response regulator [Acidimicrobiales bacterium]
MTVCVILIHHDDCVRSGWARSLASSPDIDVVASVRHLEAGVAAFAVQPHAVVVMEEGAVSDAGDALYLEPFRAIAQAARIVVVLSSVEPHAAISAMRGGARSIVRTDFDEMPCAIRLTANEVGVIDASALSALLTTLAGLPRNPLSARERDVLSCLAGGLSNAEAASRLYVSRETVKSHVAHLLRKLEVDDRFAAVDKAQKIGLLS